MDMGESIEDRDRRDHPDRRQQPEPLRLAAQNKKGGQHQGGITDQEFFGPGTDEKEDFQ